MAGSPPAARTSSSAARPRRGSGSAGPGWRPAAERVEQAVPSSADSGRAGRSGPGRAGSGQPAAGEAADRGRLPPRRRWLRMVMGVPVRVRWPPSVRDPGGRPAHLPGRPGTCEDVVHGEGAAWMRCSANGQRSVGPRCLQPWRWKLRQMADDAEESCAAARDIWFDLVRGARRTTGSSVKGRNCSMSSVGEPRGGAGRGNGLGLSRLAATAASGKFDWRRSRPRCTPLNGGDWGWPVGELRQGSNRDSAADARPSVSLQILAERARRQGRPWTGFSVRRPGRWWWQFQHAKGLHRLLGGRGVYLAVGCCSWCSTVQQPGRRARAVQDEINFRNLKDGQTSGGRRTCSGCKDRGVGRGPSRRRWLS